MKKIKVMSVFGTRPEATKMAPLINVLKHCPLTESVVAVTAQHREQLDQALAIFNITPDIDLNIMRARQSLNDITTEVLKGLEKVFLENRPDLVLVHGDTTTTLSASLSAFYRRIPVGHVEAGLRTHDKCQPYPEEMNRRLTSALADLHFAPTELSKKNLINENISAHTIHVTGNTAIDCLRYTLANPYRFSRESLNHLDFSKKVIAMTAHRRENLGEPLTHICRAVKRIADECADVEVVYAVHLNPAVRETAFAVLTGHPRVHLIDPLDVTDMHNLINRSYLVLTDSGGLQEEAPSMGKPVIVLRNVTERPEAIEAGTVVLAGVEEESVYQTVRTLLTNTQTYNQMAQTKNPFGDGHASEKILDAIIKHWDKYENRI